MRFEQWTSPRLADINAGSQLGSGQFYIVKFGEHDEANAWGWAYLYDAPDPEQEQGGWETGFTSPEAALIALEHYVSLRHALYDGLYL